MKIIVKAKTRAKIEKVERVGQPTLGLEKMTDHFVHVDKMVVYKVWVKEMPVAGKANEAILRALAEYFGVARAQVRLVSGQTSKQKIFEIDV